MYLNGKPCDEWTGAIEKTGYGRRKVNGKMWMAHRYAYYLAHGSIDPDLVIDHLCHNRACVEPAHLDQTTREANSARHMPNCPCGYHTGRITQRGEYAAECKNGHDLTLPGARNRAGSSRPGGQCRLCNAERTREFRARQKAMRNAA